MKHLLYVLMVLVFENVFHVATISFLSGSNNNAFMNSSSASEQTGPFEFEGVAMECPKYTCSPPSYEDAMSSSVYLVERGVDIGSSGSRDRTCAHPCDETGFNCGRSPDSAISRPESRDRGDANPCGRSLDSTTPRPMSRAHIGAQACENVGSDFDTLSVSTEPNK